MVMPGGEPTHTRPLVEHKEPAELLEPTEDGAVRERGHDHYGPNGETDGGGAGRLLPEVVRGRAPRWLHVGGVLLLGGEPTVNRTVRGLADLPGATLGAAENANISVIEGIISPKVF